MQIAHCFFAPEDRSDMSSTPSTPLDDWISRGSISFSKDDPASLDAAVDEVIASSGPSLELLGIGEPTHLVNDYLVLRNRFFQSLVERHGFRTIAIESSFTRSDIVNDYLSGNRNDIETVLEQGITHYMGKMPGNRALLEWMRQYNSETTSSNHLRFYGFDSPTEMACADSPRQLLEVAMDYMATQNPAASEKYRRQIQPLLGNDADWENPDAMMNASKSIGRSSNAAALRVATEDLIAELEIDLPSSIASSDGAYRKALRHAIQARQMLVYHGILGSDSPGRYNEALSQRDRMMADNLTYIVQQEISRGRVFVFAHNSHLKRGKSVWEWGPNRLVWWPAGAHLNSLMPDRYRVIGVGVGTSTTSKLTDPEPGSLEAHLLATPGPARIIATHRAQSLIKDVPYTRSQCGNHGYFPFGPESMTDFDWLVLLDAAN